MSDLFDVLVRNIELITDTADELVIEVFRYVNSCADIIEFSDARVRLVTDDKYHGLVFVRPKYVGAYVIIRYIEERGNSRICRVSKVVFNGEAWVKEYTMEYCGGKYGRC